MRVGTFFEAQNYSKNVLYQVVEDIDLTVISPPRSMSKSKVFGILEA